MSKPTWAICGLHKSAYLGLLSNHQILISALRLFQVQRQQFKSVKPLKDLHLKTFHSRSFIPHEFLWQGGVWD